MIKSLKNLFRDRHIIKRLTQVSFRSEYCQTAGGVLWMFLKPLLMVAAISAAFFFRSGSDRLDLYLLSVTYGVVLFGFARGGIQQMAALVTSQRHTFQKTSLSRDTISVLPITKEAIDFCFGILVIVGVHILMRIPLTFEAISFLVLAFLLMFFFVYGLGLILSILTVYIKDLKYLIAHAMRVLFFVTPIFLIDLPKGILTETLYFNPFSMFIFIGRQGLFPQDNITQLIYISAFWTILVLFAGRYIFIKRIHDVVDIV